MKSGSSGYKGKMFILLPSTVVHLASALNSSSASMKRVNTFCAPCGWNHIHNHLKWPHGMNLQMWMCVEWLGWNMMSVCVWSKVAWGQTQSPVFPTAHLIRQRYPPFPPPNTHFFSSPSFPLHLHFFPSWYHCRYFTLIYRTGREEWLLWGFIMFSDVFGAKLEINGCWPTSRSQRFPNMS